ncbi:kinetochore-associated Ndc80 complex subunit ndc80 [Scheffersomyces spartinae]|uniref:Kinetochore protein NDC80 n=1 Tax=Scheffersomyces spartinae TaxID=45513 RepID=A0A9P7V903_9ASCO|nr:kinetochore-associated Ndc80 complex subunit ndc80 [Scheffersomyces spartinae]KAG7193265.1 kinetochore-associated Ndc80 complex subunit ndc80 [Scheffersomyces spartinae]
MIVNNPPSTGGPSKKFLEQVFSQSARRRSSSTPSRASHLRRLFGVNDNLGRPAVVIPPALQTPSRLTGQQQQMALSIPTALTSQRRRSTFLQNPQSLQTKASLQELALFLQLLQRRILQSATAASAASVAPAVAVDSMNNKNLDQRPLRDKNYQALILQEILDFLITNKFELEMNHPIQPRTFKQPTQKDFVLIFKFLYLKIDPHYEFQRSIELEILPILKSLGYPYLSHINRSHISAVGGQNWPQFLGLLYWMVKFNNDIVDIKYNVGNWTEVDDEVDALLNDYVHSCYQDFLQHDDNVDEHYEKVVEAFEKHSEKIEEEIKKYEQINDDALKQYEHLSSHLQMLEEEENATRLLESDIVKLQAYAERMEAYRGTWAENLNSYQDEQDRIKDEFLRIELEIKEIAGELQSKELSILAIDDLFKDRDDKSKSIAQLGAREEDIKVRVDSMEQELLKKLENLQTTLMHYNEMVRGLASSGYDFSISFNSEQIWRADGDEKRLISKDLTEERSKLIQLRNHLLQKTHDHEETYFKLEEEISTKHEVNLDQRNQLERKEAQLFTAKMVYDEVYTKTMEASQKYLTELERWERQMNEMRQQESKSDFELENRLRRLQMDHDALDLKLLRERNELVGLANQVTSRCHNLRSKIGLGILELDDALNLELSNIQDSLELEGGSSVPVGGALSIGIATTTGTEEIV